MRPTSGEAAADVATFQRFEREGWDRVAHLYDDVWAPLTTQFVEPLLEAAAVEAGQRVLDLACGPGYLAAAAAARGAAVLAVDLSPAMVAEAHRRHPALEVRQGVAERLDLPSAGFDRVLNGFGLNHLADPPAFFTEALRLLRPGGRLGFTVWAGPDASPGARVIDAAIGAHAVPANDLPQGPDYHRYGDPRLVEETLVEIGFAEVSTRLVTGRWRVLDPDCVFTAELTAGVRMAALLARQAPEQLAAIRHAIADGVAPFRRGETYELPMAAYVVVARR
jgi:SAM-dependent methyltransferase